MRSACCLLLAFAGLVWAGEDSPAGRRIETGLSYRPTDGHRHAAEHDHDHDHEHDHDHGLHYSHPILTEVPKPHNVLSLRGRYARTAGGERARALGVEAGFEYAPVKWFSFELKAPYTLANPDSGPRESGVDNAEVAVKFAALRWEHLGIVVSGGAETVLPTGDDNKGIGSNNAVELEPFITMGWKRGRLEVIPLFRLGLPVERDRGESFTPVLETQLSVLCHINKRVAGLVEITGGVPLRGEERGRAVYEISPGVKFKPWKSPGIEFGVNATLPITSQRDTNWAVGFGIFHHF